MRADGFSSHLVPKLPVLAYYSEYYAGHSVGHDLV